MRNTQRQSYLHSNIKDKKKFGFWNRKKNDSVAEILGNQNLYNDPPFSPPQQSFPMMQRGQGIPAGIPLYPTNPAPAANMPIQQGYAAQNTTMQRQIYPPQPFPAPHAAYPPQPFPSPFAPAAQQMPPQVNSNEKSSKKKRNHSLVLPKFNLKNSLLTFVQWLKKPNVSLSLSLFLILPILFALSLLTREAAFKYAYIIGTITALIWIFWKKPYSDGVRLTLVVSYISFAVVIIINIVTGIRPGQLTTPADSGGNTTLAGGSNTVDQIALPTEIPVPEQTKYIGDSSEAQRNFEGFMAKWTHGDIEGMLEYISPNWKKQQSDPTNALFTLLLNRRPKEYTIENISGSDSDSARTVTMNALINKFTSKEYLLIRFQILMLREGDIWYVDPSTLGTNFQPTPTPDPNITPTPTVAPRTTVTPKPADDTIIYYNPNGGKLYHADPNCPSVNKKFLPLTSLTFGQLKEDAYKGLVFCQVCGAPH